MKTIINKYVIIIALIGFFLSCEQSTDWELDVEENSRLVVEAVLTNKVEVQKVILSQSYSGLNDDIPYITDARVEVEARGVLYVFDPDPNEPGLYKSRIPFQVLNNINYNLSITWQGEEYTATTRLASVAPLQSITFARFEQTDSLTLGDFVPIYNIGQQSFYEIDIDWSFISDVEPNRAKTFLYTFNDLDITQLIEPNREDIVFPFLSLVTVRKYGLSDDFAAYLRAKVIESDWNSIYFFSIPENLPSNISNGALGYFSACSIEERTVLAVL